ncbi:TetR/AcrR family transcriptional regulator [Herbiconiux sp. P18]|uniref:TetR/AcrR family transcriptional regulator n=1 Tax=Herbiconiux liangxiaofengii TaxID=3342795 RepID=UPI0035BBAA8B
MSESRPRMPASERRELVLDAALAVFGQQGYAGATTDMVARAAGVSQPYVVRMFGTKEQLFLEVLGSALDQLMAAFRRAVAGDPELPIGRRLGLAYFELTANRSILLCLMHAFASGADPVIGAAAREGFMRVYRLLRDEAGMDAAATHDFLAGGMLANVVLGLQLVDAEGADPDVEELVCTVFPEKLELIRAGQPPRVDYRSRS